MNEEGLQKTSNKLIFIGKQMVIDEKSFPLALERLREVAGMNDEALAFKVLHEIVPTFKTPEEFNSKVLQSKKPDDHSRRLIFRINTTASNNTPPPIPERTPATAKAETPSAKKVCVVPTVPHSIAASSTNMYGKIFTSPKPLPQTTKMNYC